MIKHISIKQNKIVFKKRKKQAPQICPIKWSRAV